MSQTRDLDILCFGEALVDFIGRQTDCPLADVEVFERCLGGAPANVAVGLARLGCKSALVTLVGADPFGQFLRRALEREGVDVSGVGVHPTARTGIAFVGFESDKTRSFTFYRHPSADMLVSPSHGARLSAARARVFHFGSSTLVREPGRTATLCALAEAREAGCLVSCDPNWRPHLWTDPAEAPELVRQTLADCDVVKIAQDEAEPLLGRSSPEVVASDLRELGVTLAVVTLGSRGCYFETALARGYVPSPKIDEVDPTAAGDGFMAGLWAALLPRLGTRELSQMHEPELRSAFELANRAGAFAAARLGAARSLPRTEDLA